MVIYNLSDDVLEVSSAQFGAQPEITAHYREPDGLLPEPGDMEIYAQNSAVSHLQPGNGTALLPVGGYVVATQAEPMLLNVRVDSAASDASYAAQLMTGYVVDNLVKALPEDSALSYDASIAECVNAAYSIWSSLNQQPSDAATNLMYQALQTVGPCQELQKKVAADKAEEIAVAAEADRLGSEGLHSDLARVAETAGEDDWESGLADVFKAAVRIAEDVH